MAIDLSHSWYLVTTFPHCQITRYRKWHGVARTWYEARSKWVSNHDIMGVLLKRNFRINLMEVETHAMSNPHAKYGLIIGLIKRDEETKEILERYYLRGTNAIDLRSRHYLLRFNCRLVWALNHIIYESWDGYNYKGHRHKSSWQLTRHILIYWELKRSKRFWKSSTTSFSKLHNLALADTCWWADFSLHHATL